MPNSAEIKGGIFPRTNQQFVLSAENIGEEQKKVFTSSDVLFSPENIGEEQKKVFTSSDVLFSPENIGEEQKKVFTSSDVLFSLENIGEEQKNRKKGLHALRCPMKGPFSLACRVRHACQECLGQRSSEETSQRWRAVGNTVADFTGIKL